VPKAFKTKESTLTSLKVDISVKCDRHLDKKIGGRERPHATINEKAFSFDVSTNNTDLIFRD
jgi:hypothetical protein